MLLNIVNFLGVVLVQEINETNIYRNLRQEVSSNKFAAFKNALIIY